MTHRLLTSILAAFLFSSHPKNRGIKGLIYYPSAYNMGRQLSHRKTKPNQTSMHP